MATEEDKKTSIKKESWADQSDTTALAEKFETTSLAPPASSTSGAAEEPQKPALPPKTIDDKDLLAKEFVSKREVFRINGDEVKDDQRVLHWEVKGIPSSFISIQGSSLQSK